MSAIWSRNHRRRCSSESGTAPVAPARATIRYADGRTVELDAPVEGGGLNYETAHFCELLRAGALESPIVTHDHSRQMIAMTDAARAALGVRYSGE